MLNLNNLGRFILDMEYAVRGPIVQKAQDLEKSGREIIWCNIGNPQALKQKPLSWVREVLALCECPDLLQKQDLFSADVRQLAESILQQSPHGLGAYSESAGLGFIRQAVADFIHKRDGIPTSKDSIFLTDGASKAAQSVLRLLIANDKDTVLLPIPQYPLYSATVTFFGAKQLGYYLDEKANWQLNREMLQKSLAQGKNQGLKARGLVVINPGNPTGSVLNYDNISMIIDFAAKNDLTLIADEVYQDNIYLENARFTSFAKVLTDLKVEDVTLFSLHSVSKGYLGECGHRGGYVECRNLPKDVAEQMLKLQSVSLCSNLPGQIMTYLMVNPPQVHHESFQKYQSEKQNILGILREKAHILANGLNTVPGIECNVVAGAMYAFAKVKLPPNMTDSEYCLNLLEETGICVVPGSGFGQGPGTCHVRTTILPPKEKLELVIAKIRKFHADYHIGI